MQALGVPRFAHPGRSVGALGIQPGMIVADFGSGVGTHTLLIAEALEGAGRVYGIDIQRDLLRRMMNEAQRQGYSIVEAIWGDIEAPHGSRLSESLVDLVLVSNLLFQLSLPEYALDEAWRILKPSGRLAIIEWEDAPPSSGGRFGPPPKHVISKREALNLAHRRAFQPLKEFDAGEFHYGLIFRPVARV